MWVFVCHLKRLYARVCLGEFMCLCVCACVCVCVCVCVWGCSTQIWVLTAYLTAPQMACFRKNCVCVCVCVCLCVLVGVGGCVIWPSDGVFQGELYASVFVCVCVCVCWWVCCKRVCFCR